MSDLIRSPYTNAGTIVPGGATTEIQYNNAGVPGGITGWTTDGANALIGGATATLKIGTSITYAGAALSPLQVNYTTGASLGISRSTANATGVVLFLGKSRGATVGAYDIVSSADEFGVINFCGADGAAMQNGASIRGLCDGTPGVGDMPGRLAFYTTADGSASPTERMRIDSAGAVTVVASLTARSATAIPAGGTAGAGFLFTSTANFGLFPGSGAPTLSAAKGSFYARSDGSTTTTRAYINTDGGTTWTALVTVA